MLSRWMVSRGRSGGLSLKWVATPSGRSRKAIVDWRSQPPTKRIERAVWGASERLAGGPAAVATVAAGPASAPVASAVPSRIVSHVVGLALEGCADGFGDRDPRPPDMLVHRPLDAHPEDPHEKGELDDLAIADGDEPDKPVVAEAVGDADGPGGGRWGRPGAPRCRPRRLAASCSCSWVRPLDQLVDPGGIRGLGRSEADDDPGRAEELEVVVERGRRLRPRLEMAVLGEPSMIGVRLAGGGDPVDQGVEARLGRVRRPGDPGRSAPPRLG